MESEIVSEDPLSIPCEQQIKTEDTNSEHSDESSENEGFEEIHVKAANKDSFQTDYEINETDNKDEIIQKTDHTSTETGTEHTDRGTDEKKRKMRRIQKRSEEIQGTEHAMVETENEDHCKAIKPMLLDMPGTSSPVRETTSRSNERTVHPSLVQVDCLMDYMERHPTLAKGCLRTASGRHNARRQWEQLSMLLNSIGGTIKTWKQWAKYWTDKKSAVKKKGILRSVARRKTGGGNEPIPELSEVEERIISLMGGVGFCEGDRHLAIQPFHNEVEATASSSVDASQAIIPPPVTETLHTDTQDVVLEERPQILSTTPTGAVTTTTEPAGRPSPIHEGQAIPSLSPPQLLSQQHTTRRRSRRTIAHDSPVSERRNHLRSLSDRFLRIEEQRLEMDRRNAQWSRERDRMFLTTITRMEQRHNETLKLLTDAIKKS